MVRTGGKKKSASKAPKIAKSSASKAEKRGKPVAAKKAEKRGKPVAVKKAEKRGKPVAAKKAEKRGKPVAAKKAAVKHTKNTGDQVVYYSYMHCGGSIDIEAIPGDDVPVSPSDDDDDAWEAIFKKQSDELLENNNGGGIPFSTRFAHPNDPEDRKYAWYRVIREYNRSKTEPAEAQQ